VLSRRQLRRLIYEALGVHSPTHSGERAARAVVRSRAGISPEQVGHLSDLERQDMDMAHVLASDAGSKEESPPVKLPAWKDYPVIKLYDSWIGFEVFNAADKIVNDYLKKGHLSTNNSTLPDPYMFLHEIPKEELRHYIDELARLITTKVTDGAVAMHIHNFIHNFDLIRIYLNSLDDTYASEEPVNSDLIYVAEELKEKLEEINTQ